MQQFRRQQVTRAEHERHRKHHVFAKVLNKLHRHSIHDSPDFDSIMNNKCQLCSLQAAYIGIIATGGERCRHHPTHRHIYWLPVPSLMLPTPTYNHQQHGLNQTNQLYYIIIDPPQKLAAMV